MSEVNPQPRPSTSASPQNTAPGEPVTPRPMPSRAQRRIQRAVQNPESPGQPPTPPVLPRVEDTTVANQVSMQAPDSAQNLAADLAKTSVPVTPGEIHNQGSASPALSAMPSPHNIPVAVADSDAIPAVTSDLGATNPSLEKTAAAQVASRVVERDQSKPKAKVSHPKPPPGTFKANMIGILVGLLLTPIALVFLVWGCKTIMTTGYSGSVAGIFLGLFEILAGTSMLGVTGVVTGYFSSLSWAVSALWPVALTVLAGPIREMVATHNDSLTGISRYSLWWDFLGAVSTLTASGLFPTMAIVMVSASLASQVAYLSGRDYARREQELMDSVDRQPGEPVAPPSRRKDHFLSIVIAVICVTAGMLALIPLHDRLAVITGAAGHISDLPVALSYALPLLGIVLLFIAVYTGSRSASGLFVSGIVCGVIPGVILAFGEASTSGWAEKLVSFLSENLTASMSVSGGPLAAFGFVVLACAMTLYWCRQSGRKDELADIAAASSSSLAASPTSILEGLSPVASTVTSLP